MSIQSEITRIINYRDLSFEACREKGVEVPQDAIIDDLPGYIALISSGGGGITVVETPDEHGGTIVTITGDTVTLQSKVATPTETLQTISPDEGYTGLSQVRVNPIPSQYIVPTGTKSITANGTGIDVAAYATVDVAVPASGVTLQDKTHIAPTESSQTILADAGYDGLSSVQIDPISSTYVGSGIDRRDDSDLTSSGATVTVPAGYYADDETKSVTSGTAGTPSASKGVVSNHSVSVTPSVTNVTGYITGGTKTGTAVTVSAAELVSGTYNVNASGTVDVTNYASISVPSGSATTPATTITANPTISVNSSGLITATASGSKSVTPTVSAGYVSSGTAGTVSVSGSNTQQLTTQAAKTVTPTKSSQQAVASGVYTTGVVTVGAIPAEYITTTDATAAAGDIVSGETAYVNGEKVTGSLVIQHYYTGSGVPSSSTGADGDIYLQTGG